MKLIYLLCIISRSEQGSLAAQVAGGVAQEAGNHNLSRKAFWQTAHHENHHHVEKDRYHFFLAFPPSFHNTLIIILYAFMTTKKKILHNF